GHADRNKPAVDLLTLNYIGLVPYLVQGMKEQQQTIDGLNSQLQQQTAINENIQTRLSQLESIVNNCCSNTSPEAPARMSSNPNQSTGAVIPIELENHINSIMLLQNDPNPFAEHTTIHYNVTADVANAQIVFYDNLGRILRTVAINDRGTGQLEVYA